MQHEETAGSVVNCLMRMGSSVRSTPMQWANESRELDCCVKYLAWAQPWAVPRGITSSKWREPPYCYVGQNQTTQDWLGCGTAGRIPAAWWTLNHRYNFDTEVQRLGAGEGRSTEEVATMLTSMCEWAKQQRYDFVKHSPDLVVYMHALRAELIMRMVMPAVLGSSNAVPALGYARFETGPQWEPALARRRLRSGESAAR